MARDKHLQDHERAHTGKPGSLVRHGQDAVGRPDQKSIRKRLLAGEVDTDPVYQRLRASLNKGLD